MQGVSFTLKAGYSDTLALKPPAWGTWGFIDNNDFSIRSRKLSNT